MSDVYSLPVWKAEKLEREKEILEQEFQGLQDKIGQLEEEIRSVRLEQYRYQGEYRLVTKLIEDSLSERAGPPSTVGGDSPSPPTKVEGKDE